MGLVEKLMDLNRPPLGILSRVNVHKILNEVAELVEKTQWDNYYYWKFLSRKPSRIYGGRRSSKTKFLDITQNADEPIFSESVKFTIFSDNLEEFIIIHF